MVAAEARQAETQLLYAQQANRDLVCIDVCQCGIDRKSDLLAHYLQRCLGHEFDL